MSPRHLPAEWASQGGVMLIWPHAATPWGHALDRIEPAMAALALAITRFESLIVVCRDESVRARALQQLLATGCNRAAITTVLVATDDIWVRDTAPIPVIDDNLPLLVQCRFNGWGNRHTHDRDAAFGRELIDSPGFATLPFEAAPITMEGGALDSDGAGSLLINRPSVLDPQRNPDLQTADAEALLARHFGNNRTLWLDVPALPGDDTDGHIDTLARFCGTTTIAHTAPGEIPTPGADATHATLVEQLTALRTVEGTPYDLVPLPAPAPVMDRSERALPASYANFVIVDNAVLVPTFADAADAIACERLAHAFPQRTVCPVPARVFVEGGGALHCLTRSLPAGVFEDIALS